MALGTKVANRSVICKMCSTKQNCCVLNPIPIFTAKLLKCITPLLRGKFSAKTSQGTNLLTGVQVGLAQHETATRALLWQIPTSYFGSQKGIITPKRLELLSKARRARRGKWRYPSKARAQYQIPDAARSSKNSGPFQLLVNHIWKQKFLGCTIFLPLRVLLYLFSLHFFLSNGFLSGLEDFSSDFEEPEGPGRPFLFPDDILPARKFLSLTDDHRQLYIVEINVSNVGRNWQFARARLLLFTFLSMRHLRAKAK